MVGQSFKRKSIPGGKEICKKQLFTLIDKVEKVELNEEQIAEFLPEINKKLSWLSREDLIKHFVSVEFNRFLSYYKDAADLNIQGEEDGGGRKKGRNREDDKRGRRSQKEFSRFFLNLGKKNKLSTAKVIGLINDATQKRDIEIGKIEILKSFSFFEVDKAYEEGVLKAFSKKIYYGGVKVSVEPSKPDPSVKKKTDRNYSRSAKHFNKRKGKKRR
jgi:ATP-dependent RNA helicase DeaD